MQSRSREVERKEGKTEAIEELKKSEHKICVYEVSKSHWNQSSSQLLYFVFAHCAEFNIYQVVCMLEIHLYFDFLSHF